MRRALLVLLVSAGSLVGVGTAPASAVPTDGVDLVPYFSGISVVDIAAPPGDDRLFVVERAGRIRIIEDGRLLPTPFLDITGPVYAGGGEQGLLGLAFDPDYETTGRFYVDYTADSGGGDTRIVRYEVSPGDPDRADPGSAEVLVTQNQPYSNHNGGQVAIGPDGYLYASFGDGGSGGDPQGNGQNTGNILGSIIRIDPETGDGAPDNPFTGSQGDDRIWVYGLRNPWRFAFDAANGDMVIGDVGQSAWEEVDLLPSGESGTNFGWNRREGDHCYQPASGCGSAGLTAPIHEYSHGGGNCSIIGGKVYRGNLLPQLRGHYFYADLCSGKLASFRIHGGKAVDHQEWGGILGAPGSIVTFGTDGYGEMYLAAGGTIYQFVPDSNPDCDFDGDGRADLAVGVPGEGHGGAGNAGIVQVIPGAGTGLVDASDATSLRQGEGVPGVPEPGDRFGSVVECGDFNGDGRADLAIGTPREDFSGAKNGGIVTVVLGGQGGLDPSSAETIAQGRGVGGQAESGDRFGSALASGDFDGDGFDDLAVGVPGEDVGADANAGGIHVLAGSTSGLRDAGFVSRASAGIRGTPEPGARFGESLAAGDVDGDGRVDLAVGVPGDDVRSLEDAGSVQVLYGNKSGLGTRDQLVHRGSKGIDGRLKEGTAFGSVIAAGRLDIDGFDDIAAGAPGPGGRDVSVVFGAAAGLSRRDVRLKSGANLPAPAGNVARAIAAGDVEGSAVDELVLGAPNSGGIGRVSIVRGGIRGPRTGLVTMWDRDSEGIAGPSAAGAGFGAALRILDLDGKRRSDVAIGMPYAGPGEVTLLKGRTSGVSGVGDVRLRQGAGGLGGNGEPGDRFGEAL